MPAENTRTRSDGTVCGKDLMHKIQGRTPLRGALVHGKWGALVHLNCALWAGLCQLRPRGGAFVHGTSSSKKKPRRWAAAAVRDSLSLTGAADLRPIPSRVGCGQRQSSCKLDCSLPTLHPKHSNARGAIIRFIIQSWQCCLAMTMPSSRVDAGPG